MATNETVRCETASSTARRPAHPLRKLLSGLDTLGLTEALPEVRELMTRADRLAAVRTDAKAHRERGRAGLLSGLADGTLDLDDAADALARIEALSATQGALPALTRDAAETAQRRAWTVLCGHGDALVSDLAPIVDAAVTEAVELAASVPGNVTDAAGASRAGGEAAATWARLTELRDQWEAAHRLLDDARVTGALPVLDDTAWPRTFLPGEHRYGRPDLVPDLRGTPVPLRLAVVHAAGAQPGAYTVADVRARNGAAAVA